MAIQMIAGMVSLLVIFAVPIIWWQINIVFFVLAILNSAANIAGMNLGDIKDQNALKITKQLYWASMVLGLILLVVGVLMVGK